jgi:hypothetical protein
MAAALLEAGLTQSAVGDGLLLTRRERARLFWMKLGARMRWSIGLRHVGTSLIHAQEGSTVRLRRRKPKTPCRESPERPAISGPVSGVGLKSSQMLGVGRKTPSDVRLSGVSLTSRGALFGRNLGWS